MAVLLGTTLLMVGTRFLWYRLVPLHLRALGASDAQVGMVFTIGLLLGPTQLLGGFVSDRWGRRYAIALPTLILVPILAVGARAQHWLAFAIIVWLISIFGGIQQPGFQALLAESATDRERGRAFGGFITIGAVATMLGPTAGAALLPTLGIGGLIGINVAGALISGLARLLLLKEGQFAAATQADRISIGDILRNRLLRRLILVNSLYLLLLKGLTRDGPFIALHAADALGLDEQAINLLFAVGGVGGIAAALAGGPLTDRAGGRRTSAVALSLHVALLVAWSLSGTGSGVGYPLFGMSWMALQIGIVGYLTWFSAFAPSAIRGRVLGLVGATASLISAAGPQLGTWLRSASVSTLTNVPAGSAPWLERLASGAPFVLALVTALVLAGLVLGMPGRQKAVNQGL
jgi:MFS family permease